MRSAECTVYARALLHDTSFDCFPCVDREKVDECKVDSRLLWNPVLWMYIRRCSVTIALVHQWVEINFASYSMCGNLVTETDDR
jgi:hypothetical protein